MKKELSIVGWLSIGLILLFSVLLLGVNIQIMVQVDLDDSMPVIALLIFTILDALFVALALILPQCIKSQSTLLNWTLWPLQLLVILYFCIDSPAPEINYSREDLYRPEELRASYDTLMQGQKGESSIPDFSIPPGVDLSLSWPDLLPHAEAIEEAWNQCEQGRQYIQDLDAFPEIADFIDYSGPSVEVPLLSLRLWRSLARGYSLRMKLATQQGKEAEVLPDFCQLHSVCGKCLKNTTSLVSKMIFTAIMKLNTETAYLCLQHGNFSKEELLMLEASFAPLTPQHTSLFRSFLLEYDLFLYYVPSLKEEYREGLATGNNAFTKLLSKSGPLLHYKPNQTLSRTARLFEPFLDGLVNGEDPFILSAEYDRQAEKLWNSTRLNNLLGEQLIGIGIANSAWACKSIFQTKIKSDLLAMDIKQRLGKTLLLNDPYTKAPYHYHEERQAFFSVGPDGQADTEDDIYLHQPD